MKNDTWELTKFPRGKVPIGSKWLYKSKFKVDGSIEKYKSRLVVKEYSQQEGIDFEYTFSHVSEMNTIGVMIALAIKHNWNLDQLDVISTS